MPGNSIAIISYFVSAGIALAISVQAGLIWFLGHRRQIYLHFAALSVGAAGFQLATAWLYSATNIADAAFASKFQTAALCVCMPSLFSFIALYSGQKEFERWTRIILATVTVLFVANLVYPYGIRFEAFEQTADLTLPWGERLHQFNGEAGFLFRVLRLVGAGILAWGFYQSVSCYRRKRQLKDLLLLASLALTLAGSLWGSLIDLGLVASMYAVGFAYLALLLLLSVGLARELKEHADLIQSNARELQIAATAFETHDAIMITDADANILRVNRAFEKITGYRADEAIGKNPRILKSGKDSLEFYREMWRCLIDTGEWSGELWDRHKSGRIYPKYATITSVRDTDGRTSGYVAIFNDISERKQAESEIRSLAFHDSLTGLCNRRFFMTRLDFALAASRRSGQFGALLFLDLDKFKFINDTKGHSCGDKLLVEASRRIRLCLREIDIVGRLGGDEFVVLVENIGTDRNAAVFHIGRIADKIRTVLAAPFRLDEEELDTSASIGVCLFCGNAELAAELIKRADVAMYRAKGSGRNRVQFFDPA